VNGVAVGGAYSSTITIGGGGLIYTLDWNTDTKPYGVALLEGKSLSVAYDYEDTGCGIMSYTIRDDHFMTALFVENGLGGLGSELAVPASAATPQSTSAATPG
jgi:hypothetical protein